MIKGKAVKRAMSESSDMDMTPMIDIVFNLLIFFMIVTDLQQKDLAKLTLPIAYMAAQDKDDDPDDRLILNVDREGHILYRGRQLNLDELGTVLRNRKDQYALKMKRKGGKNTGEVEIAPGVKASALFVLLRADKDTPWQHVQWLMTIMAEQKLFKMQFATKKFISGGYEPGEAEKVGGLSAKEYERKTGKEAR